MVNLQSYLDQKYPAQTDKEKVKNLILSNNEKEIEGRELDLSSYTGLEKLTLSGDCLKTPLTKLKLGKMPNLTHFSCDYNQLTSVDFLSELAHPEKLKNLSIIRNNFQPTTLDFLSRFINLKFLTLGTIKEKIEAGIYNRFYGSLEPLKNMYDLQLLCIAGTDVDSGLEYLPLQKNPKYEGRLTPMLDCRPLVPSAKARAIKEELKPFDYDIEAWQLAHPEKTLAVQPKLFAKDRQKEEWEKAINLKIKNVEKNINSSSVNTNPKALARFKNCLKVLKEAQTKTWNFSVPNNDNNNNPPNNNDKDNNNKNLTELKKRTKNQIKVELEKNNLKSSDLGSELADWESQLENFNQEEKVKELEKKIQQEIEKLIDKKNKPKQKEEKNNGFSLATKIVIGISVVLVIFLVVGVIYYFLSKKKKKKH